MQIVKSTMAGIVAWTVYAFISFFLFTPVIRGNFYALLVYGIQGAIFGFILAVLIKTVNTQAPDILDMFPLQAVIIIGFVSGALSAAPFIYMSWIEFTATLGNPVVAGHDETVISVTYDLVLWGLGSSFLGAVISFLGKNEILKPYS